MFLMVGHTDLPEVHFFGPGAVIGVWNILPHEFSHPVRKMHRSSTDCNPKLF